MPTLRQQMAFVQLQIEQWSEDVALGGGEERLRDACVRVAMYEAILSSLATFASSRPD